VISLELGKRVTKDLALDSLFYTRNPQHVTPLYTILNLSKIAIPWGNNVPFTFAFSGLDSARILIAAELGGLLGGLDPTNKETPWI
jgi:hypothetical protein